jgi:phosphate-selective porin
MGAIVIWTRYDEGTESAEVADTETFLSAKSWIFTIAIIWGRILQNWEKRQKTRVIYLELQYYF